MPRRDVVVIGASAGGLSALTTIVAGLPRSLRACVLVVTHSAAAAPAILPEILARSSDVPVAYAKTGDQPVPGRIFVAPPDFHLLVTATGLSVEQGPRENGFRPAIDPLFRTAAHELGARVVGVVLSGALSDGTYGLSVIKQHGGMAIVQDPDEAVIASMPLSAMKYVDVDHVLPASQIATHLDRLSRTNGRPAGGRHMPRGRRTLEPQRRSAPIAVSEMKEVFGAPSALTCPDCGGALWEIQEGRVMRYQCHVGHQYAPENLDAGQRDTLDEALWGALRVLEEQAELKRRMAHRAAEGGLVVVSQGFDMDAREAEEQAGRLRGVLFSLRNGGRPAERREKGARRSRNKRR